MGECRMLIGGQWVESGDGGTIEVENPATEELFERVPRAAEADLEAAVQAAARAFPHWAAASPESRAGALLRAAALVRERAERIARLMTMEQGKPLDEARGEVLKGAEILAYYAEEGKRIHGRLIPGHEGRSTSYVLYEPVGPSVGISPWNYPVELIAWKLGAALAAGCTIVLKPPSQTPLSPLRFVECLHDSGLPPGVVNLVFGAGPQAGPRLIRHPLVKKVAFTGSTDVGREVVRMCAEGMKRVSLELGGHCPLIVSARSNLGQAVRGAVRRSFRNNGQICISINRIYVEQAVYEEFLGAFLEGTRRLTMADGLERPDADLGPMASKAGVQKAERHIEEAVRNGAKIACGGRRPDGEEFRRGYFFLPTILTDVTHEMLVMKEETFGPVVGVMPYRGVEQAVEYANSTSYGLAAYLYTDDLGEADEFTARLESGNVAINTPDAGVINAPYGGFKDSGMGYEHGREGLEQYLRAKHVRIAHLNRSP
jgi:succinate-semialdehyde dehydrogenase/glutarate-semialdehyde dehydrogenase